MKQATTVYLEVESYKKLKELVKARFSKPISQEIDELIIKRLAELEGTQVQINADEYEDLKHKHFKLVKDADAVLKRLYKMKVYDNLEELADKLNLNFGGFSNMDEVTPKILKEWDGSPGDAHQFITLLEIVREIWQVERRLAEVRNAKGET